MFKLTRKERKLLVSLCTLKRKKNALGNDENSIKKNFVRGRRMDDADFNVILMIKLKRF